jgi:hypothetical protein
LRDRRNHGTCLRLPARKRSPSLRCARMRAIKKRPQLLRRTCELGPLTASCFRGHGGRRRLPGFKQITQAPSVRYFVARYCVALSSATSADYRCSHSIASSADPWPDEIRLSDLEPRFVCQRHAARAAPTCGRISIGTNCRTAAWDIGSRRHARVHLSRFVWFPSPTAAMNRSALW